MKHSTLYFLVLVVLLSYWAVRPLFLHGFFPVHDDTHPARVQQMANALSHGQFPVRWVSDLGYGYGYPIFNFYAPIPYYIGAGFFLLGFDAIEATKLMFFTGTILSAITMFLFVSTLGGNLAGLFAAVLYQYAPYHAVNIYVRGAVGEYYAYGFFPLVILGIFFLIQRKHRVLEGVLLTSFGFASVILSHAIFGMITGVFFSGFIFLVLLFSFFRYIFQRRFTKDFSLLFFLSLSFLLGIGLSSFYSIPAFFEKDATRVRTLAEGGSSYTQHFVYLDQLWDWPWGYAGSAPLRDDGMSFKIGKLHLILGIFSLFFLFSRFSHFTSRDARRILLFGIFPLFLSSVFLMLDFSLFFWRVFPLSAFIQYPWRFLNFTLFSLSVLGGLGSERFFWSISHWRLKPAGWRRDFWVRRSVYLGFGCVLVLVLIVVYHKYFFPSTVLSLSPDEYIGKDVLRGKISRISDEYLPGSFDTSYASSHPGNGGVLENETVVVRNILVDTPTKKVFSLSSLSSGTVLLAIAFFPGWVVTVDGEKTDVFQTHGLLSFPVSSGDHVVSAVFTNTFVRTISNSVSFLSVILLLYVSLFFFRNKERRVFRQ